MAEAWRSEVSERSTAHEQESHTHDARLERRLDLLGQEQLPVDRLGEERMALDLLGPVDAESLRRIARQEPGQQRARVRGDLVREAQRVLQDLGVPGRSARTDEHGRTSC